MPIEQPPELPPITSPPVPSDPSTLSDITNAIKFRSEVEIGRKTGHASLENLTHAELYVYDVMRNHRRDDESGLRTLLEQVSQNVITLMADVAAVKADVAAMKLDIAAVKTEVTTVKAGLAMIQDMSINTAIISAREHNFNCGDGELRPYAIVRRPDGQIPGRALPPLHTAQNIIALSRRDAKAYCTEYGLVVPAGPDVDVYQKAIAMHIGCIKLTSL